MSFYEKYNFLASQTAIKDFEKELTCPFRWKAQWLEKSFSLRPNDAMMNGLYFERLVIGSSANDEPVEIPTNKDGSKKAHHLRIDEQAEFCKKVLFDKGFEDYIGTYIGKEVEWKTFQHVIVHNENRIVIDLDGECDEGVVICDLKLTADVTNTFGSYTWGKLSNMDLFQQGFYQMVFEESTGLKVAKNLLVVFDYSTNKGKKIIDLNLTNRGRDTIINRINAFNEVISLYEERSWPITPSVDECENCPLECKFRIRRRNVLSESAEV